MPVRWVNDCVRPAGNSSKLFALAAGNQRYSASLNIGMRNHKCGCGEKSRMPAHDSMDFPLLLNARDVSEISDSPQIFLPDDLTTDFFNLLAMRTLQCHLCSKCIPLFSRYN